jgi:hypothetical protein
MLGRDSSVYPTEYEQAGVTTETVSNTERAGRWSRWVVFPRLAALLEIDLASIGDPPKRA